MLVSHFKILWLNVFSFLVNSEGLPDLRFGLLKFFFVNPPAEVSPILISFNIFAEETPFFFKLTTFCQIFLLILLAIYVKVFEKNPVL